MPSSAAILDEMHVAVREAAEPPVPGERVAAAILRAARFLDIPYSRARRHWYRLAEAVSAVEADHVRASRERLLHAREARLNHDLRVVRARIAALREGGTCGGSPTG